MTRLDIGFDRALELTLEQITPLPPVEVPVWEAAGAVPAQDIIAEVDSPSLTAAARDGFALRSSDVSHATEDAPARLRITGALTAGQSPEAAWVEPGGAVRVTTGAPLPEGADAVVAVEFTREAARGTEILALRDAAVGRNVLRQGQDVSRGDLLAPAGAPLTPAATGLLAAGGIATVDVHPRPSVAVVATGDEVVAPGQPLAPGQLYASNLVTMRAWMSTFGVTSEAALAPDDPERLSQVIGDQLERCQVVMTSGGAWKSARDYSAEVLSELGFELLYHRVRLAPGKAVAFGVRGDGRLAFCLPGGPPSNEMALLQLALPALLACAGRRGPLFPTRVAELDGQVRKQRSDPRWTNFFQAELEERDGGLRARPLRGSRLTCQARAEGLIKLPEGVLAQGPGETVEVQVLPCL